MNRLSKVVAVFSFDQSARKKALFLLAAAWLLAGCGSGLEFARTPAASGSIRVANLTGPPEEVRTQVLSAIGAQAQSEGLDIAIEGTGPAEFVIAGFLTAVGEVNSTEIAYVWDVTEASGRRAHRITGTITAKRNADPWQAVDTKIAAEIAKVVVTDLKAWQEKSTPEANSTEIPTPPTPPVAAPAALVATATSQAPLIGPRRQATRNTRSAPTLALASTNRQSKRLQQARKSGRATRRANSIALVNVTGASDNAKKSLANGLRKSLGARGLSVNADPDAAGYRLIADVSTTPPERGHQTVAIVWTVGNRRGRQLGTVRQVNRLPPKKARADWSSAAEAASNGIVSLILANPVQ